MGKRILTKCHIQQKLPCALHVYIWFLVGLVRSMKSSHKEALKKNLLYEDYSNLTGQLLAIYQIYTCFSVVYKKYDTLKNIFHACMYILINSLF